MARNPSYRAPSAKDVLRPHAFVKPQAPMLREQSLLDAVIANPDDDAPRLALAEWYEAHGEGERATFIRSQLAGRSANPNPMWSRDFEPWCARDLVYRRGFVEEISLAGRSFLTLGEPLFRMTPLRVVRLVAIAAYFRELFDYSFLTRLRTLDLRGNAIPAADLARLRQAQPTLEVLG